MGEELEPLRPKKRDRQVLTLEQFTDEDLAAIAEAKVPPEYAHLDKELDDDES